MNFTGYDGLNAHIQLSARSLKAMYEVLKRVTPGQLAATTEEMKKANFVMTVEDVEVTVKQMAQAIEGIASTVRWVTAAEVRQEAQAAVEAAADPDDKTEVKQAK